MNNQIWSANQRKEILKKKLEKIQKIKFNLDFWKQNWNLSPDIKLLKNWKEAVANPGTRE